MCVIHVIHVMRNNSSLTFDVFLDKQHYHLAPRLSHKRRVVSEILKLSDMPEVPSGLYERTRRTRALLRLSACTIL
jgi:hypothetical protein